MPSVPIRWSRFAYRGDEHQGDIIKRGYVYQAMDVALNPQQFHPHDRKKAGRILRSADMAALAKRIVRETAEQAA